MIAIRLNVNLTGNFYSVYSPASIVSFPNIMYCPCSVSYFVWIIITSKKCTSSVSKVFTTLNVDTFEVRRDEKGANMGVWILKWTLRRLLRIPSSATEYCFTGCFFKYIHCLKLRPFNFDVS